MAMGWLEIIKEKAPETAYELAVISDAIWAIGTIEDIKAAVKPEVFQLFVAMNAIGIWEGEGWGCLIGDNPILVSYIGQSLKAAGYDSIAEAFYKTIAVFPDFTAFQDNDAYYDVINFLQNVRFKVMDERLNQYSAQQRQEMSRQFRQAIGELEDISEPLWGNSKGWGSIIMQIGRYC